MPVILIFTFLVNGAALGESGHEVRCVQERLSALGYFGGRADGLFSPELTNAVRSFQHDRGLPGSGSTDSLTLGTLFEGPPPEDSAQKLLAKYIALKSAGKPYWEKLACGKALLGKLKNAESPDTLSALILREAGAAKLLRAGPDSAARQAAAECLASVSLLP